MSEGANQAGKYLSFKLAKEEYGIPITKVKEIIGMMAITRIPQRHDYMKGVINLRGSVIPVIDLRARFNMENVDPTDRTCIIVVEISSGENIHPVGIIVDSVSEVIFFKEDQIAGSIHFGKQVDDHFITGLAKTDTGVKILLDVEYMVSGNELSEILDAA